MLEAAPAIRRFLLALLLVGLVGTGVELLLLEHYEDSWQLAPLAAIALALVVLVWHGARPGRGSLRAVRIVMSLFLVAGAIGVWLHYRANVEFQLEIDAQQSASRVFWKALRAKAPPALAPGVMAQLGLLGLIYGYRHPAGAAPRE